MKRIGWLATAILFAGCGTGPSEPGGDREFILESLNESSLPYDHEGLGCCIYLGGSLQLQGNDYTVSITARNRNNNLVFTVREWGSFTEAAAQVTFVPEGFEIQPLLLDVATVANGRIRVSFGGEGPGSPDQFRAVFHQE